jgi:hypothetical protein
MPRRMEVARLVGVLVEEHARMREGMLRAKGAAAERDFGAVSRALKEVDPVFRQHIADEESQILGLLIAKLGVKGAEAEIAVFRQHRPIYGLMQRIGELAGLSSAELEARQSELERLFEEHTSLEESRVFPRALTLSS